jgi:hypothetical protein
VNPIRLLWQLPRRLLVGALRRLLGHGTGRSYRHWIAERIRQRRCEYEAAPIPGLFSILTSVYNTPPRFLRAMARSVVEQDYPWFEWIVVDNGTTEPATRAVLRRLCREPRVRFLRLESNRGILGGMRAAFAQARGRYVLPVDSDDRLYPDALRVLAHCLRDRGYPAVAYSDEDKLTPEGQPCHPFFKPDWDPVLFLNCCYVAHLGAIAREAAADVGAYTDDAAHGCHDWDTFLRLLRAGCTPVHVPEVLYSWRMHAGSTAWQGSTAKPFTIDCQYHVLSRHLELLGAADRFEVRANPLFRGVGLWSIARRHWPPAPPIHVLVHAGAEEDHQRQALHALALSSYPELEVSVVGRRPPDDARAGWIDGVNLACPAVRRYLEGLPPHALVAVLDDGLIPQMADWAWEALGLFELHADTAVVGGRIMEARGLVRSAGEVFSVGGLLGCPVRGLKEDEYGPYGTLICQRSTGAVDGGFFVARAGFLASVLARRDGYVSREMLGGWLGAAARRQGLRVVFTPFLSAHVQPGRRPIIRSAAEEWEFLQEHWPLLLDDPTYARFLSLDPKHGYELATPAERADVLNPILDRLAGLLSSAGRPQVNEQRYVSGVRVNLQPHDLPRGEEDEAGAPIRAADRQLEPAVSGARQPPPGA